MKRQIRIDRIGFDALMACLGGFDEAGVMHDRKALLVKYVNQASESDLTNAEIASLTGYTLGSVSTLICARRLKRRRAYTRWSAEDLLRAKSLRSQGFTYREIASLIGRPPNRVRARLSRARKSNIIIKQAA